jgi:hypothetical protein
MPRTAIQSTKQSSTDDANLKRNSPGTNNPVRSKRRKHGKSKTADAPLPELFGAVKMPSSDTHNPILSKGRQGAPSTAADAPVPARGRARYGPRKEKNSYKHRSDEIDVMAPSVVLQKKAFASPNLVTEGKPVSQKALQICWDVLCKVRAGSDDLGNGVDPLEAVTYPHPNELENILRHWSVHTKANQKTDGDTAMMSMSIAPNGCTVTSTMLCGSGLTNPLGTVEAVSVTMEVDNELVRQRKGGTLVVCMELAERQNPIPLVGDIKEDSDTEDAKSSHTIVPWFAVWAGEEHHPYTFSMITAMNWVQHRMAGSAFHAIANAFGLDYRIKPWLSRSATAALFDVGISLDNGQHIRTDGILLHLRDGRVVRLTTNTGVSVIMCMNEAGTSIKVAGLTNAKWVPQVQANNKHNSNRKKQSRREPQFNRLPSWIVSIASTKDTAEAIELHLMQTESKYCVVECFLHYVSNIGGGDYIKCRLSLQAVRKDRSGSNSLKTLESLRKKLPSHFGAIKILKHLRMELPPQFGDMSRQNL